MALVQKKNSQRTIILIIILVVVIGGGSLFYFFWVVPPVSTTTSTTQDKVIIRDLQIISDFDDDLFDDPRYRSLEPFGDLPVNLGNIGRDNPFEEIIP